MIHPGPVYGGMEVFGGNGNVHVSHQNYLRTEFVRKEALPMLRLLFSRGSDMSVANAAQESVLSDENMAKLSVLDNLDESSGFFD